MKAKAPLKPAGSLAAFVLHSHAWSESSLILELFTREQGRLIVVAKGAKRPYSQLRSVLLPFQRLQVQLGRPRVAAGDASGSHASPEILNLRSAEWDGSSPAPELLAGARPAVRPAGLTGGALFSGFYLNELLLRLMPRSDPHPVLFDAYASSLSVLSTTEPSHPAELTRCAELRAASLRAMELVGLREAGLLPDLSVHGLRQAGLNPNASYAMSPEWGVVELEETDATAALSAAVLIELQATLEHGSFPALLQACTREPAALKAALRGLLDYHLHQLGAPALRSRQIAREAHSYKLDP